MGTLTRNAPKLAFTCLMVSLTVIVLSWADSYPVFAGSSNELTISRFSPWYWVGLGVAVPSVLILAFSVPSRPVHLFCAVMAVLLYSSPFLFYRLAGADAGGGVIGHMDYFIRTDSLDPRQRSYFQWPLFFCLVRSVQEVLGLGTAWALQVVFIAMILVSGSSLYLFFSKGTSIFGFFGCSLYFMAYPFLNWQAAPQPYALCLMFFLFNLTGGAPVLKALFLLVFFAIVFSHPAVGLWVIFTFLVLWVTMLWRREPAYRTANCVTTIVLIQATALLYYATLFFGSVVVTMKNALTTAFFNEPIAPTAVQWMQGIAAPAEDPLGWVLKGLSITDTVLLVSILGIGLIISLKRRSLDRTHFALIVAGALHFVVAFRTPFPEMRGSQVSFLGVSDKVDWLLEIPRRRAGFIILLLAFTLFPIVLLRKHWDWTLYWTESNGLANEFLGTHALGESEFSDSVLGPGASLGYLSHAFLPKAAIANPRRITSAHVEQADWILLNSQLESELSHSLQMDTAELSAWKAAVGREYAKIYDSGYETWWTRLATASAAAGTSPGADRPAASLAAAAR